MGTMAEEENLSDRYYPDPDQLDIDFKTARPLNRFLGDAIIYREGGVNQARRIGGFRRDSKRNRRIEIWNIRGPACILRVRHLDNSFYFEINYPDLEGEIRHLIESGDWWVDHVAADKLVKIIPDEYLPNEGYSRPNVDWGI